MRPRLEPRAFLLGRRRPLADWRQRPSGDSGPGPESDQAESLRVAGAGEAESLIFTAAEAFSQPEPETAREAFSQRRQRAASPESPGSAGR